jgi:hypothetical protein
MPLEDIIGLIFEDSKHVKSILDSSEDNDWQQSILEYGISVERFLCIDYKGEESSEIVNYILDYEFNNNIELASQEELESLEDMEYEYLVDKIKGVNKVLEKAGYGLFVFPTGSDFSALFIAKLDNKEKLLQEKLPVDDELPLEEKYIQYYI